MLLTLTDPRSGHVLSWKLALTCTPDPIRLTRRGPDPNRQGGGQCFFWKLNLTRTHGPTWPTRLGPDPNRPTRWAISKSRCSVQVRCSPADVVRCDNQSYRILLCLVGVLPSSDTEMTSFSVRDFLFLFITRPHIVVWLPIVSFSLLFLCQARVAGWGIMFSRCPSVRFFVRPSVHPFVCYQFVNTVFWKRINRL